MQVGRRGFLIVSAGAGASLLMGAGPKKKPIAAHALPGPAIRAQMGLSGVSGWMLIDLDSGEVLDAANPDQAFVPASVAKLPTAAFALDAMGADFRFETRVRATGAMTGGRLGGDLILEGGGDPELDTDALATIVGDLHARGLREISGAFLADGSALPQLFEIEPEQSDDAGYNPSLSGLNLNFNRVHLKWDARKGSLSVEAEADRLSPQVDGVRVHVAATKGRPIFSLRHQDGREVWEMAREAFRGRAARWLPVKRPEVYAGEVFRILAGDRGMRLPMPEIGATPPDSEILVVHRSRPLGEILREMLRYSTNLTAEATGVSATRLVGIAADKLSDSAGVMNAWAASVAGFGVGDPGFRFANHSGLSLDGRASPRRMVELLAALGRRTPDAGAAHSRLPGGIAGYLRPYNVAAKDIELDYDRLEIVAKTGTMNYVRGLSGYIATPRGRRLAFAIFSNDLARRTGAGERVNRGWIRRARNFERALIRSWVIRVDGLG